jgi:mono/diheme cytochrome c family protein
MEGRYVKLLPRILSGLVIALTVGAGAGAVWFFVRYPRFASPPTVSIHVTDAVITRGRYLANHVAVCVDCHSSRDWNAFSGPIVPGTEGAGGEQFGKELGYPGTFYAANITPAGLSQWSDGEILRAITSGVTRTGRAMYPVMPYPSYRALSEGDAEAIVAYIRTLTPVAREIPASQLDFPMNVLIRTLPEPYAAPPSPDRSSPVAYGQYLTKIARCPVCHTRSEGGSPVQGMEFAGGADFDVPRADRVQSANITPDSETGIGDWPRAFFIARFRDPTSARTQRLPLRDRRFNTVMPWTMFAGMTDEDLSAIYAYLRTVRPVRNQVARFTDPR